MIPGISFQTEAGTFSRPIMELIEFPDPLALVRHQYWKRSITTPLLKSTLPAQLPFPESPIPQFPSTSIL